MVKKLDSELLWAAALFVGEGTFTVKLGGSGQARHLYAKVGMYDQRAVERYRDAVQPYVSPSVRGEKKPPQLRVVRFVQRRRRDRTFFPEGEEKVYWNCQVGGAPALGVAEALYGYLWDTDKGDQLVRRYQEMGRSTTALIASVWGARPELRGDAELLRRTLDKANVVKPWSWSPASA